MNLGRLFGNLTNADTSVQNNESEGLSNSMSFHNHMDLMKQLQNLVPGQTIQAQVLARNGSQVQLKFMQDYIFDAKVDANIKLNIGENVSFEVKHTGSALQLSPLFVNTAAQPHVYKALEMAGVPVNHTSVHMTEELMEAGLPINREFLQKAYREVSGFKDYPVSDVVNLYKLSMPVTKENMEQMAHYRNLTYQLESSVATIAEGMEALIGDLIQNGDEAGAAELLNQMEQVWEEIPQNTEETGNSEKVGYEVRNGVAENEVMALDTRSIDSEIMGLPEEQKNTLEQMTLKEMNEQADALSDRRSWNVQTAGAVKGAEDHNQTGTDATINRTTLIPDPERGQQQKANVLTAEDKRTVTAHVPVWKQRIRGLAERLQSSWTLEPEQIAKPDEVEKLYRRMKQQLGKLSNLLEENEKQDTPLYKAMDGMNKSVDFLQQINQMYSYVQLPLRLKQGNAHGDLYVYGNRKNLLTKDGPLTAFLHLNMEHLGPVDVLVSMEQSKVETEFRVADESVLDFLEQHMDQLIQRLQKRGYQGNCRFQMKAAENETQDSAGGLEPLLENVKPAGAMLHYAFDVRT